jgi:hypothetical protein
MSHDVVRSSLFDTVFRVRDIEPIAEWLMNSDSSIRWQVMRDILHTPESEWQVERDKVETTGWGAQLLSHRDEDGQWAGGAFIPRDFESQEWQEVGQPWTATSFSLSQLREFGLNPTSESARRVVRLIGTSSFWFDGEYPYWEGETEECINGRVVADGAYFGVGVSSIVQQLIEEQLDDGGWNCERVNGSVRSSFATTINVLEGLLEFETATGGTPDSLRARKAGEEYLLQRNLFRRLSTGELADEQFIKFTHPSRWHYDVLRALDYFRLSGSKSGASPDPRLADGLIYVRSRRLEGGKWPLDASPPGRVWFDIDDGVGLPSRWVTLRAMRVLDWWEGD